MKANPIKDLEELVSGVIPSWVNEKPNGCFITSDAFLNKELPFVPIDDRLPENQTHVRKYKFHN